MEIIKKMNQFKTAETSKIDIDSLKTLCRFMTWHQK